MTDIKVIDNFLPDEQFVELQNLLTSNWFPWYKLDYKINPNTKLEHHNEKYNMQLIHTFYNNHRPWSEFLQYLDCINQIINPLALVKIKANLSMPTEQNVKYALHQDFANDKITTGIFYINTNNGYTYFDDNTQIDSIENRMVMFNSKTMHAGTTCTDEKYRIVLNLNFIR